MRGGRPEVGAPARGRSAGAGRRRRPTTAQYRLHSCSADPQSRFIQVHSCHIPFELRSGLSTHPAALFPLRVFASLTTTYQTSRVAHGPLSFPCAYLHDYHLYTF